MNKVFHTRFSRIAMLILMLVLFNSTGTVNALAQDNAAPGNANPTKVFFNDCGHNLADRFLNYWRTHSGPQTLGCPISEEFSMNGINFQYFSKARLEYHPENAGKIWEYSLGLIGSEIYDSMSPDEKANPAYTTIAAFPSNKDRTYYSETGHSLSFGFKEYWNNNEGLFNFGLPISEEYPYTEEGKSYSAQDFERARLIYSKPTGTLLANIGQLAAKTNKIETAGLSQEAGVPSYSPALWERWVEVNLSQQRVYFHEGDLVVRTNLVTTGKPGHATPTGTFYIQSRVYNERMRGGSIGSEDYYDLSNVLHTQYFTNEGHALHYAWWRSQFGVTGSHGCVNMDYDTSLFAWNFVGLGSRIFIHY